MYLLVSSTLFISFVISNSITVFEGNAVIIFCVPLLLYLFLFLTGTKVEKIIAAVIPVFSNVAIASVTFMTVANLFKIPIEDILSLSSLERLLFVIIANMILAYVLSAILKLARKNKVKLNMMEILLNMSILVISIVVFTFLNWVSISSELSRYASDLLLGCLLGLVLIDLVVFYLVSQLSKSHDIKASNELLSQQLAFQDLYTEQIKQQYKTSMHIKHDIKHSLSVLNVLISKEEFSKAQELLEECIQSNSSAFMLIETKNPVLNAIATLKLTYASSLGIKTFCVLPEAFNIINDIDLCILIGNMLDNAIEYCQKHLDKYNEIALSIVFGKGKYTILVRNTIYDSVLENNKRLKTSKENRNEHGFGLETIKGITQKYKGIFDCYEESNMFFVKVMLFPQ